MRALTLAICLMPGGALAQASPEALLRDLLSGDRVEAAMFAPVFLNEVPLADLRDVLNRVRQTVGPVTGIEMRGDRARILTDTHAISARIGLTPEGRIAMLFFEPPTPRGQDLDGALAALAESAPQVAWLVRRDGSVLSARAADTPVAVASAFKLGVLAVLAEDIDAGLRTWSDVVTFRDRHRSLPSGQLQILPDGAPLTLHTAAALMIAISDNTATDLLIDVLGRDRIAVRLGLPVLLTTREVFALTADPDAAARYLAAPVAERPAIARAAAGTLPEPSQAAAADMRAIGWDVSLTRLCDLMDAVGGLEVMALNPGPVPAEDWRRVAYKGGSLPGVLSFVAQLTDAEGQDTCVAAAFRSEGLIETERAAGAYRAVVEALRMQAGSAE